jgi:hypothetical protein
MNDKELDREENFRSGHVCPDRELHDGVDFDIELRYTNSSGIGENVYIKCLRCGTQQDITDYNSW